MEKCIREHMGKRLFRELSFTRDSIDAENRTVVLAFASEAPYERVFGFEILDVTAQSMRLGRLVDGAPLLWNHNPDRMVGVVESVEIGSDRIARAVVRFGKGEEADEIFQDVVDGIRRKVSVGYMIHDMALASRDGNTATYRVTDWEPYEISIVSIPADNGVGVGRSIDSTERTLEKMTDVKTVETPAPAAVAAAPAVDVAAIQNEVRQKELQRVADLRATGSTYKELGGVDLAEEMVRSGKGVQELESELLKRAGAKQVPTNAASIGMDKKDVQRYSFARAIRYLLEPNDEATRKAASFEIECSQAAIRAGAAQTKGGSIVIPHDVLNTPLDAKRSFATRDMVAGTFGSGGALVNTTVDYASFIDVLRNKAMLPMLGARTLSGLVGDIYIPRKTQTTTAYWINETGNPTESQPALDMVGLKPKTLGAYTDVTRQLLMQASMDVEAMIRNDIAETMALEIDRVALYGTGGVQPLGVKNTTGVQTSAVSTDGSPTFGELVDIETKLAAVNADIGNMAYLTNATVKGNLKKTQKVTGQAIMLWENNELNGYAAYASNQVATNDLFFANWSDLLIGFWGGIELAVDESTHFLSGGKRIRALQSVDVALRRPISFCYAT